MNPSLTKTLKKKFAHRLGSAVFSKENGEILAYETILARFAKDQRWAGVPQIGIHGMRHTFASHFVINGGNIYDLKALIGHSDIGTTMKYAHLSDSHLVNQASLVSFSPFACGENVIQFKVANHFPTIAAENKKAPSLT